MANLQKFDAEIEKTRQTVEDMKTKLEQSSVVLDSWLKPRPLVRLISILKMPALKMCCANRA